MSKQSSAIVLSLVLILAITPGLRGQAPGEIDARTVNLVRE